MFVAELIKLLPHQPAADSSNAAVWNSLIMINDVLSFTEKENVFVVQTVTVTLQLLKSGISRLGVFNLNVWWVLKRLPRTVANESTKFLL